MWLLMAFVQSFLKIFQSSLHYSHVDQVTLIQWPYIYGSYAETRNIVIFLNIKRIILQLYPPIKITNINSRH